MRRLALVVALALAAAPAAAPPPAAGTLVPGRSLGGLRLGATRAQVEARWGGAYGVCRNCGRETWYFNYYAFRPEGTGVEFRNGRAIALFTLWAPKGWRTPAGLEIGDDATRVTELYGPLARVDCPRYYVLLDRGPAATTAYYVLADEVWAFALLAPAARVCR